MATKSKLVAAGLWGGVADAVESDFQTGAVATGSTQATALALTADATLVATTAASTGVLLRAERGSQTVYNGGANALAVYPPVGGTINNGAANAAFSVGAGKSAMFMSPDGAAFVSLLSA